MKSFYSHKDSNHSSSTHAQAEVWNVGDAYTNYWESPTWYLDLEDDKNILNDNDHDSHHSQLIDSIIHNIQDPLEQWIGMSLQPFTYYGIRIFQHGAKIPLQVDGYPILVTAMIHVPQDIQQQDEEKEDEWPIQVHVNFFIMIHSILVFVS